MFQRCGYSFKGLEFEKGIFTVIEFWERELSFVLWREFFLDFHPEIRAIDRYMKGNACCIYTFEGERKDWKGNVSIKIQWVDVRIPGQSWISIWKFVERTKKREKEARLGWEQRWKWRELIGGSLERVEVAINSRRSTVFRRVLYIYTCMRRWGIEREKKEKLSRTGSKSWRGRQTRCNLIETFIRSPSYIKHRPLKMRWRDNLIWAGLIDRPIPKDARGKEAWRERKNGETKRGVEEREWKFSLPRTSFSFSLVERRGKGREKSGREAFSRKRETIVFHMKRAHNATIFVREAEPAAPLSLRIVFPLSLSLCFPFLAVLLVQRYFQNGRN